MSVQAASGRTVQTVQQTRLALVAVIRAHERVARLLVALGDHDGAGAERRAAEGERARLARLDARLVALGGADRPACGVDRSGAKGRGGRGPGDGSIA